MKRPKPAPLPSTGGSYLLDEETGDWVLIEQTLPANLTPEDDGTYTESPSAGEG